MITDFFSHETELLCDASFTNIYLIEEDYDYRNITSK